MAGHIEGITLSALTDWMRLRTPKAVDPIASRGTAWSGVGTVIEIGTQSQTLRHRAFEDTVDGQSVIDWVVRRVYEASGKMSPVCVIVDAVDRERLLTAMKSEPCPAVVTRSAQGCIEDLQAAGVAQGRTRLLVGDLAIGLLPKRLLERLLDIHTRSANKGTILLEGPCLVPPFVVELELLRLLVQVPKWSRNARVALRSLLGSGGNHWRAFRPKVGSITRAEGQASNAWPKAVELWTRGDVTVLRRTLELGHSGESLSQQPLSEPLDRWLDEARYCRQMRRAANIHPTSRVPQDDHDRARRVLFAQSPSAFSGVEQVIVLLAKALGAERQFRCSALLAKAGILSDRLRQLGVPVNIADCDFAESSIDQYMFCRKALAMSNPDIVHSHAITGVPFGCAVIERGVPFVQHVHVASASALDSLGEQLEHACVVVAVSEFVRRRLARWGVEASKLVVIHNGCPEPLLRAQTRADIRHTLGIPPDARVILLPARFAPNKRHDVAVDAFSTVRRQLGKVFLVLAGEAYEGQELVRSEIYERVRRLSLADSVRFMGFWPDMTALYAAADLLMLPSENDPLPMTVLEAMASGVPVVAARSGGTPEMISDGDSGLLVEEGDSAGFATATINILSQAVLRESIVNGAYQRWRQQFSIERFVANVNAVYATILSQRSIPDEALERHQRE